MIEVIIQNYNKTKGPQKNFNKTRFEVHCNLKFEVQPQFGGQFC